MVHVSIRSAALIGLAAAVVSAQQAPVNCGKSTDLTGPSDMTIYHAGSSDFIVKCHEIQRQYTGFDWIYAGTFSIDECISRCASSNACSSSVSTYNLDCFLSAGNYEGKNPSDRTVQYISAYKRPSALNCKDKSSNGTIYTPPGSSNKYQILCDYQYDGATIGSKRADTFEQCVSFCDTTTGCVDTVYSDAKYCWLKSSKKADGYRSPGWFSAIKVTDNIATGSSGSTVGAINCRDNSADNTVFVTPFGTYDIRCNFQYDGDTIASKSAETFEDCVGLCGTTDGCVDVVWSDAKYCWLKSSMKGSGYKSGGWYSAIKRVNAN